MNGSSLAQTLVSRFVKRFRWTWREYEMRESQPWALAVVMATSAVSEWKEWPRSVRGRSFSRAVSRIVAAEEWRRVRWRVVTESQPTALVEKMLCRMAVSAMTVSEVKVAPRQGRTSQGLAMVSPEEVLRTSMLRVRRESQPKAAVCRRWL